MVDFPNSEDTAEDTPMNFKNKRLPGKMALWLAACALIIAADIPAQAETSKTSLKGPGVEQTQETGTSDKNADTATADITQAIVVDENGGFHVAVSYYKKQTDGTWSQASTAATAEPTTSRRAMERPLTELTVSPWPSAPKKTREAFFPITRFRKRISG